MIPSVSCARSVPAHPSKRAMRAKRAAPGSLLASSLLALVLLSTAAAAQRPAAQRHAGQRQEPDQAAETRDSVWQDPAAVERGRAMLDSLIETAGGREAWKALGGLRLDVLESYRVIADHSTGRWAVHHYVPRLCHFTPEGNGFLWSEFVDTKLQGPTYRRQVAVDGVYWAEMGGQYTRAEGIADKVRGIFERHLLLGAMPFSIELLGARLAYVRTTTREVGDARKPTEVYSMRLPKGHAITIEEGEKAREFLVLVDPETRRVVQLQYIVDRRGPAVPGLPPFVRCYVDLAGTLEVGGVKVPRRYEMWREDPNSMLQWTVADPQALEVPPAALRKPWLTNTIYVPRERADAWDPPGGMPEAGGHQGTGRPPKPPDVGPPPEDGGAAGSEEESSQGR